MNGLLLPHPSGARAAAAGASLSLIQGASVDSGNITVSASAAAGDGAIVFESSASSPTITIPTGWTELHRSQSSAAYYVAYYRKLVSGDVSSSIGAMSGGSFANKVILVFRLSTGAMTTWAPFDVDIENAVNVAPAAQTISGSTVSAPAVACGFYCGNGTRRFSSVTAGMTKITPSVSEAAYIIQNSSPGDFVVAGANDGFMNRLSSVYMQAA